MVEVKIKKKDKKKKDKKKNQKSTNSYGQLESKQVAAANKHHTYEYGVVDLTTDHPVIVGVSLGFTIKTADFENVRGQVTISVPSDLDKVDDTYKKVRQFADEKLGELQEEMNQLVVDPD